MDISELFPAGPIIDERHQIGRLNSIEALTDRLRAGDVVRVFDRRRWGKSSVARAALSRLTADGLVAVRLPLDEYPTALAAAAYLAARSRRGANAQPRGHGRSGAALERPCRGLDRPAAAKRRQWSAACSRDSSPRT